MIIHRPSQHHAWKFAALALALIALQSWPTAAAGSLLPQDGGVRPPTNEPQTALTQDELNAALFKAAKLGTFDEVEKLLKDGADIAATNGNGVTLLHDAVMN